MFRLLELLQMFLVLLPLRLVCRTDSVLPAVRTLLRLGGTAENKMALIANKNHFNHREITIPRSPRFAKGDFS